MSSLLLVTSWARMIYEGTRERDGMSVRGEDVWWRVVPTLGGLAKGLLGGGDVGTET